jgi:hypothetical protein
MLPVVLTEMDTHFTVPREEPSEIQEPTTGELEVLLALK